MGFYFQDDFWEAASELPRDEQDKLVGALVRLYFTDEETELEGTAKAVFSVTKTRVRMARQKAERQSRWRSKSTRTSTTASTVDVTEDATVTSPLYIREGEGDISTNVDIEHVGFDPIISHLNERAGKRFSAKSKKTRSLIAARMREGFTEEDFRRVIDNMSARWKGDARMDRFLRPETLFGTKFEGYLNSEPVSGSGWSEEDSRYDDLF